MEVANKETVNAYSQPMKEYGQGVFSSILLPVNEDHIAVGNAIRDLLKEGWLHDGIDKEVGKSGEFYYFVKLKREWKC